jgi:hypothetical protein
MEKAGFMAVGMAAPRGQTINRPDHREKRMDLPTILLVVCMVACPLSMSLMFWLMRKDAVEHKRTAPGARPARQPAIHPMPSPAEAVELQP